MNEFDRGLMGRRSMDLNLAVLDAERRPEQDI
jgi:hypothetical protein